MSSVADFFRTPGSSLVGRDLTQFNEIKEVIERSTNELLLRPDWEANINCCDLVNSVTSQSVLAEMMFLIRKKLASRQPKVAFLAVALVETLVKNCGTRLHAAVNDEGFMKELAKTARKYLSKTGAENREVAEIAMDIIQAWGEAFLPRQRQFPNIVRTYQDMRKEGLPFKAQYDSSRVPIFTPSGVSTSGPGSSALSDADTDAILAAALAASMIDNPAAAQPHSGGQAIPATSASKLPPEVEALSTSISLLADLIAASSSARDLAQNDLAAEMAAQIGTLHPQLMSEIETQLIRCTEGLEELFVIHDAALCIAGLYRDAKSGTKSIEEVMSAWQATAFASRVSSSSETSTVAPHASAPPASSAGTADLLDLPDATPASAPTASSSSNGSGLLDLNTLGISFNPPAASKAVTGMTTATILSDTTTMGIHAMATAASASTTATRRPSGGSVPTLAPPSQQAAARKPSINASSSTNTTPAPVAAPVPKVVEFDPFGSAPSSSIDELLQATAPGAVWSSAGSGSGVPANSTGSAADSLDALLTVATRPVDTIPPPIAQGASNSSLAPMQPHPQAAFPLQPRAIPSPWPMAAEAAPATTAPAAPAFAYPTYPGSMQTQHPAASSMQAAGVSYYAQAPGPIPMAPAGAVAPSSLGNAFPPITPVPASAMPRGPAPAPAPATSNPFDLF